MATNPLFNALNGGQQANPMQQLIADAKHLRNTVQNPRETVQQLVASGQMSQDQFNQFAQIAQQIVGSGAFK